jgi:flavorubredoxin
MVEPETVVDEIADRIYRISTFLYDFVSFNQYLVVAEEPLLYHCGQRPLFESVSAAAARVVPLERLRWIAFGHVESDECGSMNQWLASAPDAQVAHGQLGCIVQLNDLADRQPTGLDDGERIDLGGRVVRHFDTPHVPHAWDARVLFEETTGTLFGGDLFTQSGRGPAVTDADPVGPAIAYEDRLPYSSLGPSTTSTIRRLAGLRPRTIALMHGPAFRGDGERALLDLADFYEGRIAALSADSP